MPSLCRPLWYPGLGTTLRRPSQSRPVSSLVWEALFAVLRRPFLVVPAAPLLLLLKFSQYLFITLLISVPSPSASVRPAFSHSLTLPDMYPSSSARACPASLIFFALASNALLMMLLGWISSLASLASGAGVGINLVVQEGRLLEISPLCFGCNGAGEAASWALFFYGRMGVVSSWPVLVGVSGPSGTSGRSIWTGVVRPVVIWVSTRCLLYCKA